MAFISIRSTSPEATSTASPGEEVRSKAELLGDHHQQQEQQSRPHRVASGAPAAAQAERNVAWLVAFAQKGWCKSNRRIRVPSVITNKMIIVVIEEAAKTFKVPVSAIYESNIHNLLKNRQVVVRN
jgi:hypothetical protein